PGHAVVAVAIQGWSGRARGGAAVELADRRVPAKAAVGRVGVAAAHAQEAGRGGVGRGVEVEATRGRWDVGLGEAAAAGAGCLRGDGADLQGVEDPVRVAAGVAEAEDQLAARRTGHERTVEELSRRGADAAKAAAAAGDDADRHVVAAVTAVAQGGGDLVEAV